MLLSIESMIAEGNQACFDSDVSADFRLVGAVRTPYSEASASLSTRLNRLMDAADGSIDEVHELRKASGADRTIMIVNDTDSGAGAGIAHWSAIEKNRVWI